MNFNDLLDEILDHPQANRMVSEAKSKLYAEKRARMEFRKWLTPSVKAEFINGEVILHSPVKSGHLRASKNLNRLLDAYVELNDLGEVDVEKALMECERNDYEPDIIFWKKKVADKFDKKTMIHPPGDLVVEILSKSTESKDRGVKFRDYASHKVSEYWIIDPIKETLEQYILENENSKEYTLLSKLGKGNSITCQVIKDFTIPIDAIFDKKLSFQILEEIMAMFKKS